MSFALSYEYAHGSNPKLKPVLCILAHALVQRYEKAMTRFAEVYLAEHSHEYDLKKLIRSLESQYEGKDRSQTPRLGL